MDNCRGWPRPSSAMAWLGLGSSNCGAHFVYVGQLKRHHLLWGLWGSHLCWTGSAYAAASSGLGQKCDAAQPWWLHVVSSKWFQVGLNMFVAHPLWFEVVSTCLSSSRFERGIRHLEHHLGVFQVGSLGFLARKGWLSLRAMACHRASFRAFKP